MYLAKHMLNSSDDNLVETRGILTESDVAAASWLLADERGC